MPRTGPGTGHVALAHTHQCNIQRYLASHVQVEQWPVSPATLVPARPTARAPSAWHWKEVSAARRVGETGASRCGGQLCLALEGGLGGAPGPAGPVRIRCQPIRRPALPGIGGRSGRRAGSGRTGASPVPADTATSSAWHWKEVWAARRVRPDRCETGASRCGGRKKAAGQVRSGQVRLG